MFCSLQCPVWALSAAFPKGKSTSTSAAFNGLHFALCAADASSVPLLAFAFLRKVTPGGDNIGVGLRRYNTAQGSKIYCNFRVLYLNRCEILIVSQFDLFIEY
jgi:hypothetical protein